MKIEACELSEVRNSNGKLICALGYDPIDGFEQWVIQIKRGSCITLLVLYVDGTLEQVDLFSEYHTECFPESESSVPRVINNLLEIT